MAYAHGESYTAPKSERTGRRDFIVGGLAGLVIAGSVPSVPQAHAQPPQISHMQHVQNMEGKTNEERGMYVVNALKSLGYEPRIERYSSWGIKGFNIIFETGTGKQVIVFTSHYDAFPGSPGANDNASSVAVSINAYQELAKQDLSNVKARFIVFGDEEKDLVGSKQHVKSKDNLEGVIGVYSMELSGIGDTLVAWDVTSKKLMGSRIMQVLDKVVQSQGLELYKKIDRSRLPNARGYQSSDHVPFEDKDIDAFGLTIVPISNVKVLSGSKVVTSNDVIVERTSPRWANYHTEFDKSESLEPKAMQLMQDVVIGVIREFNRSK